MITKELKQYGDVPGWYLFRTDNLICPACGENISSQVEDSINRQYLIVNNIAYGTEPEHDDPGPVCPKCEAMVNFVVKNNILIVEVGKDVARKDVKGVYRYE